MTSWEPMLRPHLLESGVCRTQGLVSTPCLEDCDWNCLRGMVAALAASFSSTIDSEGTYFMWTS